MTQISLPVPPGFVITTQAYLEYFEQGFKLPKGLTGQVTEAMKQTEKSIGLDFGNPSQPLLVSVRSGAAVSMPGMMDTVLNLGINDETVLGLIKQSGDERFGWRTRQRAIFC